MKILLLSDSNSPHTIRWAKAIHKSGFNVIIFSLHTPDYSLYSEAPDIQIFSSNVSRKLQTKSESTLSKVLYLNSIKKVHNIINEVQPDIVHAHYASSYGFIGALTNFHPYIISLWGGDVFGFPNFSLLHRAIFKYSLSKSDLILSTSRIMKEEVKKYSDQKVIVTPFGIDTDIFKPKEVKSLFKVEDMVIGTIKTLEVRYGIEYLIKAFKIVRDKFPDRSVKLLIAGEGTQKENLKYLCSELNISNDTIFAGYVKHENVQDYHNMLDIYVAVSLEESFGVAILEASACCKPVIVSNVGGLPEVVGDNSTGFIVEKKNSEALAKAIIKLVNDRELRVNFGKNGRMKVLKEYDWKESVSKMVGIYKSFKN